MRVKEIAPRLLERLTRTPQAPRRERDRVSREAKRRQRIRAFADARALESGIEIARICDGADACRIERGDDPRFGYIEPGAQDRDSGPFASRWNRRQAVE